MAKKVVLISDPGIDGAFAIALALYDPELEVVGMLATPGNVPAQQATKNLRIVLEQLDPPRLPRLGAAPEIDYGIDGAKLHGPNGLGHTDFPAASLAHLPPSEKLLAELVRQYPDELTVVCMGPLTVLSRAFDLYPDLPTQIKQIIVVGGAILEPGNAGPVSEFHFFCDAKAARRVVNCPASVLLLPLDVSRKVLYSPTDLLGGESELSPAYHFLRQVVPFGIAATSHYYGIEGFHLKDVLGVVAVGLASALSTAHMYVDVEIHGELTRGMTVFDRRTWERVTPNVEAATDVDTKAVREYIRRVVGY
ncbi:MAG: nucleoside hydrolase [Planctomycetes bacterium]|nr:nucleoside hydrolase [Planctomycetota bacterium]